MSEFHPSKKPLPGTTPGSSYKPKGAINHKIDDYNPYQSPSGMAAVRAAEKHAHELEMIKNLLTAVLNQLDLQGHAIDEIYDMLDCYLGSKGE